MRSTRCTSPMQLLTDCISLISSFCSHELLSTEVELSKAGRVNQSNTGAVIPPLKAILQKINTVYTPLFQRKEEADRIRHALTVLKRHHLLFSMPGQLTRNIKVGLFGLLVAALTGTSTRRCEDTMLLCETIDVLRRFAATMSTF